METTKETLKPNFFQRLGNALLRFFGRLSERLQLLSEVAMANLYTLILLVIIYLFYWTFPQAKDLPLTINQESHFQIMLFFTSLVTLPASVGTCPGISMRKTGRSLKT